MSVMNRLFVVLAMSAYTLMSSPQAHAKLERVKVSWYKCCNPETASGKRFNPSDPTIVAHKRLSFGTRVWFRNPKNGKTLCAEVADRGPYVSGRTFDLTHGGARKLGIVDSGIAVLEVAVGVRCSL